jgi:hypothetical protein
MDMAASIDEVCLMNLARWRTKNRIGTALGDFGGKLLEDAYGRLGGRSENCFKEATYDGLKEEDERVAV